MRGMLRDDETAVRESGLFPRPRSSLRWRPSRKACGFLILFLLSPNISINQAQSWTQPAGRGQIIGTVTLKTLSGGSAEGRSGRRFGNIAEFSPFVQYGATDWLTVIVQPRLQLGWGGSERQGGYGETDMGARMRLWSDTNSVFSLQAVARLPASLPRFGDTGFGADVRGVYGTNLQLFNLPAFFVAEAGYRRWSDRPDQWVSDVTLGVKPADDWMVLAQSFNRFSLSFSSSQTKLQLSVVHRITERLSLQLGGYATAYARNSDRESGIIAALWYNF